MADPEVRTRSLLEIADHAAALVTDAQDLAERMASGPLMATTGDVRRVALLVERLAAQVEDLAAAVYRRA